MTIAAASAITVATAPATTPATPLVNLLPWRLQRRRTRRRFWLISLCLPATLVLLLTCWLQQSVQRQIDQLAAVNQQQQTINQQLQHQLKEAQARYQRQQQVAQAEQAALARRQQIHLWRQRLTQLAEALPASAWLTSLSYQPVAPASLPASPVSAAATPSSRQSPSQLPPQSPSQSSPQSSPATLLPKPLSPGQPAQLRIEGYTFDLLALQKTENRSVFSGLPGFSHVQPGTITLDNNKWQFCFLLTESF